MAHITDRGDILSALGCAASLTFDGPHRQSRSSRGRLRASRHARSRPHRPGPRIAPQLLQIGRLSLARLQRATLKLRSCSTSHPRGALWPEGDPWIDTPKNSTALHYAACAPVTPSSRAHPRAARPSCYRRNTAAPLQLAVKACIDAYWKRRRQPDSVAALLAAGATTQGIELTTGYGRHRRAADVVLIQGCPHQPCLWLSGHPLRYNSAADAMTSALRICLPWASPLCSPHRPATPPTPPRRDPTLPAMSAPPRSPTRTLPPANKDALHPRPTHPPAPRDDGQPQRSSRHRHRNHYDLGLTASSPRHRRDPGTFGRPTRPSRAPHPHHLASSSLDRAPSPSTSRINTSRRRRPFIVGATAPTVPLHRPR